MPAEAKNQTVCTRCPTRKPPHTQLLVVTGLPVAPADHDHQWLYPHLLLLHQGGGGPKKVTCDLRTLEVCSLSPGLWLNTGHVCSLLPALLDGGYSVNVYCVP